MSLFGWCFALLFFSAEFSTLHSFNSSLSKSSYYLDFILSTVCRIRKSLVGWVPFKENTLNSSMDFQTYFGDGEVKTTIFMEGNYNSASSVRQPVSYSLRSCASTVLVFPKGKMLSTFGDRTFSMAAPKLWNALPAELRSISSLTFSMAAPKLWNALPAELRSISSLSAFKSSLKTYLFKLAFHI